MAPLVLYATAAAYPSVWRFIHSGYHSGYHPANVHAGVLAIAIFTVTLAPACKCRCCEEGEPPRHSLALSARTSVRMHAAISITFEARGSQHLHPICLANRAFVAVPV